MQRLTIPDDKVKPMVGEFYHHINKLTHAYSGCHQAQLDESYGHYWLIPTDGSHVEYYYYFIPNTTDVVVGALGGSVFKYDRDFLWEHLNEWFKLNGNLTLEGILGATTWQAFKKAVQAIGKPKVSPFPPPPTYKWILSKKGLEQCTATAATSF